MVIPEDVKEYWDAFRKNANWQQLHYRDKERLYRFFASAHLSGLTVGEQLIDGVYQDKVEGSEIRDELVNEADIVGEALIAYDELRAG